MCLCLCLYLCIGVSVSNSVSIPLFFSASPVFDDPSFSLLFLFDSDSDDAIN